MGTLAGPRLRKLRAQAHQAFDPLWQEGGKVIGRSMAYLIAGRVMSIEDFHIGHLDEGGCIGLIAAIPLIDDALIEFAEALLNPVDLADEATLDVVHSIFWDEAAGEVLTRVLGDEMSRLGPTAERALRAGLVVFEDAPQSLEAWALLTEKGRRLLERSRAVQ